MKNIICVIILLFCLVNVARSQDKIITKQGTVLNVKIVHEDRNALYFYQPLDSTIEIRQISKDYVKDYSYVSTNNGKNKAVVTSDSLLFAKYMQKENETANIKSRKYKYVKANSELNTKDTVYFSNYSDFTKYRNTHISKEFPFRKVGNRLIVSGSLFMLGTLFHTLRMNTPEQTVFLTDKGKDDYERSLRNLSNTSSACYAFSGLFLISAGIELSDMRLRLK